MGGGAQLMWEEEADAFDDQPDHGLRDPMVRAAWAAMLLPRMPVAPASVVDLGCGTGSLSVLLAHAGHIVRGMDLSGRMVELARRKADAAGCGASFVQGDAAEPPFESASFDVVLARHVLWAMPDPSAALARWVELLRPGGRVVLIEGRWSTGVGLTAGDCRALVLRHRATAEIQLLGDQAFWGKQITDERYVLVSLS
jgi:SAM-dependent methyltransferase